MYKPSALTLPVSSRAAVKALERVCDNMMSRKVVTVESRVTDLELIMYRHVGL